MAGGVLSDVYYPTIDNTNVETLRYIVTDGSTFTDVQGRDTTYTVAALPAAGAWGAASRHPPRAASAARHRLHHRPRTEHLADERLVQDERAERASALRALRSDGERQRRRRQRQRRRRLGADRHVDRPPDPRRRTIRARRRTRRTGTTRSRSISRSTRRSRPTSRTASQGARPTGSSSSTRSHALTTSYAAANNGNVVQTARVAGSGKTIQFTAALGFGSTQAGAVGTAESSLQSGWPGALDAFKSGWQAYDAGLNKPPTAQRCRESPRRGSDAAPRRVLRIGERPEGGRGQDVPGRARRSARVAVGPGDLGRRPAEHLLRLLPGGLRPRSLRDLDRADGRRRHGDRQGRDAVPLRPPAAARRVDAAQQPRERQARTRLVRRAARRDGVSAADGGPAAPHRSRRSTNSTSSRPRTSSPRTARRSGSSAGRSRAATRRRRSPRRSPGSSRPPTSPMRTTTPPRPRSGAAPPTTSSARSRAGR